jgi:hypothetical protein
LKGSMVLARVWAVAIAVAASSMKIISFAFI